jgi:hypothetical protein
LQDVNNKIERYYDFFFNKPWAMPVTNSLDE